MLLNDFKRRHVVVQASVLAAQGLIDSELDVLFVVKLEMLKKSAF